MAKSWQQILIERLINDEYDYRNPTNSDPEFVLKRKPVFPNGEDHEKWFYAQSQSPYSMAGLKEFAQGNKRALEDDIPGIPGTLGHRGFGAGNLAAPAASQVSELVKISKEASLFNAQISEDIFNAVRAKIKKVYEEGKVDGAGKGLWSLGEKFTAVVQFIKTAYPGSNLPANPQLEFETMLVAIKHTPATGPPVNGFFSYMQWTGRFDDATAQYLEESYDAGGDASDYHMTY